jgi:hypothetical protein
MSLDPNLWDLGNTVFADWKFITFVSAIFLLWTIKVGRPVKAAVDQLSLGLATLRHELEQVGTPVEAAARYEAMHDNLSRHPLLGAVWVALDSTLAKPREPGRPLRQTVEATRFFNHELLRKQGADMRAAQAHANMLVGFGLFLTFIGLVLALKAAGASLSASEVAEMRAGLNRLLTAVATKFWFSVIGLLLSLCFAMWLRKQLKRIDRELDRLVHALTICFPPLAPQDVAMEGNELLTRLLGAQQTFLTDLAHSIDQSLGRRLAEQIDPLRKAIEKLSSSMATMNQEALDTMLRRFVERLEGAAGTQLQELTKGLVLVSVELKEVIGSFKSLKPEIEKTGESVGKAIQGVVSGAGGDFTTAIGAAADRLKVSASEVEQSLTNAAHAFGARTEAAAGVLATALADFPAGLSTVEQQIREAAATFQVTQRELTQTTGVLETTTSSLSSASTGLRDTGEMLRSCIIEVRGATQAFQKTAEAQQQLGARAEALAKLLADAAARFQGLDERLAGVFGELSHGLEAFQQNVQDFVAGTDQGMAAAARHLLAAIDRLAEDLEEHALRSTTQADNQ